MNIIIFSKDRACQLELLLRSLRKFFPVKECEINILFKATNDGFFNGYMKLMRSENEKGIFFIRESHFKRNLLGLENRMPFTTFLCDDEIIIDNFSFHFKVFNDFKDNPNILCLALRLGKNLTENLELGKMRHPNFDSNIWPWRGADKDWGYPMSLSGCHIFRTEEIFRKLNELDYDGPNILESRLADNAIDKPLMVCPNESIIFGNAANIVQTVYSNAHGDVSAEFLNEQFLNGKRIKLEPFLKSHSKIYDIFPVEFE